MPSAPAQPSTTVRHPILSTRTLLNPTDAIVPNPSQSLHRLGRLQDGPRAEREIRFYESVFPATPDGAPRPHADYPAPEGSPVPHPDSKEPRLQDIEGLRPFVPQFCEWPLAVKGQHACCTVPLSVAFH